MAVDFTMSLSNADALRFSKAVGRAQNLGRDATAPECKQQLLVLAINYVQAQERAAKVEALADDAPISPT